MKFNQSILGLSVALVMLPSAAFADGLLVGADDLTPDAWTSLNAQIAQARAETPAAFEAFDQIRSDLRTIDAAKRGPYAPMTRMLKALGPNGLMPMLEAIAVRAEPVDQLPESAQVAFEVGLLEASGALGDARARPVLRAVLDSSKVTEFLRVRAAAQGLGGVCDAPSAAALVRLATSDSVKRNPVLTGMGWCRRPEIADTLATAVTAGYDARTTRNIIRSLSDVGNSWVWQALARSGGSDVDRLGMAVRASAARGLLNAYVNLDGSLRRDAEKAILVVDSPDTPTLIEAAMTVAPPTARAALAHLKGRFATNPVRHGR